MPNRNTLLTLETALLTQAKSNDTHRLVIHKNGQLQSRLKKQKGMIKSAPTHNIMKYLEKNKDHLNQLAVKLKQAGRDADLEAIQNVINNLFEKQKKLKKAPDLFLHINENWMANLPEPAKQRKMNEFVLPGTHDSGAYQMKLSKTPKGKLGKIATLINLGRFVGTRKLIRDLTLTQNYNFSDQLNLGARYLDLRVCYNEKEKKYYISHSFACTPLEEALSQIKAFMASHPEEIVMLQIQPDAPHRQNMQKHKEGLYDLLDKYLGELAVRHDQQASQPINDFGQMSYQELINKNQRVVLGFHQLVAPVNDKHKEFHWKSNLNNSGWLNKPNVKAGLAKLNEKIENSQNKENTMHCVATSLTPKDKEYIKRGVRKYLPSFRSKKKNPGKLTSSIIKLGREMNEHIPKTINAKYHGIVYCDSPDHSAAFNHLISLNSQVDKHKRHSNPS